ncbi:MAG: hypothetical protein NDI63_06215 [Pseudobdellovibrio sp.]|nr:hypothetical protein [Pseudobdellovibrio sp.]
MKSITEFQFPTLQKILTAKTTLTAEGKSPEEVATAIGESFKYEGDKLKYALAASDLVAGKTSVRRVLVASANEGETPAANYQQVDGTYYQIESFNAKPYVAPAKTDVRGGGKKGGRRDGPKGSPWGMSPEELAHKNKPKTVAK